MAEDLLNLPSLTQNNKKDLLSLENQIAEISDCIIVILESPSAFAELGTFANHTELVKQLLIVNDADFADSPPFINLGPIMLANKKSKFKPAISVNLKSILSSVGEITYKLDSIKRKYNRRLKVSDFEEYELTNQKEKMFLISDIIHLFCPISQDELYSILIELYGSKRFHISMQINLLQTLGIIEIIDKHYITSSKHDNTFLEFGVNKFSLRSLVINYYNRYVRTKDLILQNRVKN